MWLLYYFLYLLVSLFVFFGMPLFTIVIPVYLITHFVKLFSNHYYFDFFVDRIQPRVRCPSFLEETINTPAGITVDLNKSVSTGATFYPNQFITLNPATLDGPLQVKATLQGKWETSDTCTFLIYTKGTHVTQFC